jgi:hypothetical protein
MVLRWLRRRCFVCRRPLILHTTGREYACEHMPLPIALTENGLSMVQTETAEVALHK